MGVTSRKRRLELRRKRAHRKQNVREITCLLTAHELYDPKADASFSAWDVLQCKVCRTKILRGELNGFFTPGEWVRQERTRKEVEEQLLSIAEAELAESKRKGKYKPL